MNGSDSNVEVVDGEIRYHDPTFKRGYSIQGLTYMYITKDKTDNLENVDGFETNSYMNGSGCCFVNTRWLFEHIKEYYGTDNKRQET